MRSLLDELLHALPAAVAAELRALAGAEFDASGPPSHPAAQVVAATLLDEQELAAVGKRLGAEGCGAGPVLRALFQFPDRVSARRIAGEAGVLGRTDWIRFVLGRLPGATPPPAPLPLDPDLVYGPDALALRGEVDGHDEEGLWPFERAREFVRSRGLINQVEWYAFARGDLGPFVGRRPRGIPFNPVKHYMDAGYAGMRDWIGGPWHEAALPGYLNFRQARGLVRALGLAEVQEWRDWLRGRLRRSISRPRNLPVSPELAYVDCWRGFADFFGVPTGRSPQLRGWRKFESAREFARSLHLVNVQEWRAYVRGGMPDLPPVPDDIPSNPESVYESCGFKGYGDWLGSWASSSQDRASRPFEDARKFARSLGFASPEEWYEWSARGLRGVPPRPPDVPALPWRAYRSEGWAGWLDFLGLEPSIHRGGDFRSFEQARAWAQHLGLASNKEWRAMCRGEIKGVSRPSDIPSSPENVYFEEWMGWGDFLGTGSQSSRYHQYRSFEDARRFAQGLGLSSNREWRAFCRGELPGRNRPSDVPAAPEAVYAEQGWSGWGDFLGTGNEHPGKRRYRAFEEARRLARSLGLRNKGEWTAWHSGKLRIGVDPPDDVPSNVRVVYRDRGWSGWGDFLGTGNLHARDKTYRSYEEARRFARQLPVKSCSQWRAFCKGEIEGHRRPEDIPANPHLYYRGRGWTGWQEFLGA